MNVTRMPNLVCTVALLLCTLSITANAERPAHGRVSYDAEGTFLRGEADSDWVHATLNSLILPGDTIWVDDGNLSEVELDSGTYLRMAHRANARILALKPSIHVRGISGSFYIHRLRESSGDLTFETPAADVIVPPDALVRVDIETNGGTTAFVLEGTALITIGADHRQSLGSGLQVYVEPGHLASETLRFDGLNDDFDAWNRDRMVYIAAGYHASASQPILEHRPLGVAELASNGRWIEHQGARCWQPDPALAYVPYREGYWTRVGHCGDVWIGRYGFEYTTSHYGRWSYVEQHGWLWHYDPQWSPAWVASVKYGPSLVWSPLGLDNRPVLLGANARFQVGGLTFSFGASTLVPVERVYQGYTYVEPARVELLPHVQRRDIQIWNIDINNIVVNSYKSGFGDYALYTSDSSRTVRGLYFIGNAKRAPRDVVSILQKNAGNMADFKARNSKKLAGPSARPTGKAFREVHLKDNAKLARTQAGPGHGKAKHGRDAAFDRGRMDKGVSGPPEKADRGGGPKAKDNKAGGPPEKADRGGGPKAKDNKAGGPPEKADRGGGPKAKGNKAGGPPDKGSKGGGVKQEKGHGKGDK